MLAKISSDAQFLQSFLFSSLIADRPNTPHSKHSDAKDAPTPSGSAKQKASSAKKSGNATKKIRHR